MAFRLFLLSVWFAAVAWTAQADAVSLDLRGDSLALAVQATASQPGAPVIGSQAQLNASPLDNFAARVSLGTEAGDKTSGGAGTSPWIGPSSAGRWSSGKLGLGANWAPTPFIKFDLTADDQIRRDIDRVAASWNAADQRISTRASGARLAATFLPASSLSLQVEGGALDHRVETDAAPVGQPATADVLRTSAQSLSTTLQWKAAALLSLEGGGRAEAIGVAWAGGGARDDSFSYLEPRLSATLTPWTGGVLRLGLERVVSPLRADQFALFAQAEEQAAASAGPAFAPDREWRYQASVQQRLGDSVDLKATYTRARLESVTDLGPVGTSQAPIAIGPGQRDEVAASLSAPLRILGVPPLTLVASAAWRASQVDDPFTRAPRRLSGEAPYDAQLTLSPQGPGDALRWGVNAKASAAATTYQMGQTSTQSASAGLGGFVEYRPGPIAIQLSLDNVVGGGRTERDVYFTGPRELNLIGRIEESRNTSRALRLSLMKPL